MIKTYFRLYFLALVLLALDQATKFWIKSWLPEGTYFIDSASQPPVAVIDSFFYLVHIQNDGAAWGIFSGHGFWLGLLGIGALIAIYSFRNTLMLGHHVFQYAFGLIIGGIIGNMIDRFSTGKVVDFLDFHLPLFGRYPSFNIADCGITIGVGVYIVYSFILERKGRQSGESNVPDLS